MGNNLFKEIDDNFGSFSYSGYEMTSVINAVLQSNSLLELHLLYHGNL